MDMIKDRDRTTHTYNRKTAREIATNIEKRFFHLFVALKIKMQSLYDDDK